MVTAKNIISSWKKTATLTLQQALPTLGAAALVPASAVLSGVIGRQFARSEDAKDDATAISAAGGLSTAGIGLGIGTMLSNPNNYKSRMLGGLP